jgi:hypothetical protein
MDKQLFNEVIGKVPPSTVGVAEVIAKGRRADRIRRVANPVVAAGIAVVVLSGAVAYTVLGGEGGTVGIGGQPSTSQAPPPSTPKGMGGQPPQACSRTDLETPAQVIARMTPLVKASVQAQRSDVTLEVNPVSEDPTGEPHGPLEFFQVNGDSPEDVAICERRASFYAKATVRTPDGDGNLLVVMFASYADNVNMTCEDVVEAPVDSCEKVPGPDGMVVKQKQGAPGEDGLMSTDVDIWRADGTTVRVRSANTAADVKGGHPATSEVPPFNLDQLVAIGTAPGMTLFP